MELAFGFVSICLSEHQCSPAGSVTVKQVANLESSSQRYRILSVAKKNLENTLRIMWFLRAHDIKLYRISANLIPLATHEITNGWAWWEENELREVGAKIGRVARENGYRLSSHLPELCGFTSEASFRWAQSYLTYHEHLFKMLDLEATSKIVLHIGGAGTNKKEAMQAARRHLGQLSEWARARVVLENDDRAFNLKDAVELAEEAGLAVAFDWHHHWVNAVGDPCGGAASDWIRRAFALWGDRPPKIHVFSPRSAKQVRAHADYVDPDFLQPFWTLVAQSGADRFDLMVEAKKKDLALFKLRKAIKDSG